jgi:hypothetical protein
VCKETKPIEMFVREARQYSGYGFTCKPCHRNKQKKRSVTKFGLTLDQFEDLKRKQRGACAICGASVGNARGRGGGPSRLAIDHDHSTGIVRGLLCIRCNTGIGLFEERVDLLEATRRYLSKVE